MKRLNLLVLLLAASPVVALAVEPVQIPPSFAWPRTAANQTAPGFKVRVVQADPAQVGFVRLVASSARAEAQLAGALLDPATRQPYADIANKTGFDADGTYPEAGVIDYDQAGAATALFPGIPDGAPSNDDFSLEAVTFLDLQPGTYTMIVNSDDGFRLSAGRDARDWFGRITVGEAEGGRSAADTTFSFSISQAGLYSFRLLYYEAGGGANVVWFADENRVFVNDPSGSVKAFRSITTERPTYVRYVDPAPGATNVPATSALQIQLGDGDTVQVNPSSIELYFNGVKVTPTVAKTNSITKIVFDPPGVLLPLSSNQVRLVYVDTATPPVSRTEQYSFTAAQTVNITLPAPLYFENFDSTPEGSLPAGWTEVSYTDQSASSSDVDFGNLDSAAYAKWTVVNVDRFRGSFVTYSDPNNPDSYENDYKRVLSFNPANIVNGEVVTNLASGRFVFGDSGYRNGASQVVYLFTPDFSLSGKTDVYLSFHSLWEQNQDSIAAVEYSIDGGQKWLPIIYLLDAGDVVRDESGQVDAVATFSNEQSDIARYTDPVTAEEKGGSYGAFIGAEIAASLAPYISARVDDNAVESKRVELFRLEQADNQAKVRFRFAHAGTDSWYFGIDDFGLYSLQATSNPTIAIAHQGNNVVLTWTGAAGVVLQKSTSLTDSNWQDVAGTSGASTATDPISGTAAFYRLFKR
ncbi:MAG: hypothetical protein U1G07_22160 [Verrucomicrobiota bacterium]